MVPLDAGGKNASEYFRFRPKTQERAVSLSFSVENSDFSFEGKRFFRVSSQKNALAGHFDGAIRRGRKKRIGIGPVPAEKRGKGWLA